MARRIRLGELLVRQRAITQNQLDEALLAQRNTPLPLGALLIRSGALTEDRLLEVLAARYNVRPWRLDANVPPQEVLDKLPASVCRSQRVLPVAIEGDRLILAMADPDDIETVDLVTYATRMRVEPVLADTDRLVKLINTIHGGGGPAVEDLVDQALRDFQIEPRSDTLDPATAEEQVRPVVGMVNQILADAIRLQASDIHIEPRSNRVDIRYRVDGQLRKVRDFPIDLMPMVTTRLKIMTEIDIVEFRVPQDGRLQVVIDGRKVDLRVSVLPSHHGQRIVLRVLDKANSLKRLEELGFAPTDLLLFRSLVRKPYGLFLVTGPTGSGKTTTLYAALNELRDETNNVMTCEDPVEYELDGVNQSQTNERVGLTFARQLRALLRQDPDIILVGEIRDAETAETAVRASITGHMVLSTLHCNDAPSAVPRLLDMGIDPFMLGTSLVGTMSQRLLRMLCPACKRSEMVTPAERALYAAFDVPAPDMMWRPGGCAACHESGYRGRRAIHEIMPVVPAVAHLIAARAPLDEVATAASLHGYTPMQRRALEMVAAGRTSLEEARRVVFLDVAFVAGASLAA